MYTVHVLKGRLHLGTKEVRKSVPGRTWYDSGRSTSGTVSLGPVEAGGAREPDQKVLHCGVSHSGKRVHTRTHRSVTQQCTFFSGFTQIAQTEFCEFPPRFLTEGHAMTQTAAWSKHVTRF